jgi:hypothetical protein
VDVLDLPALRERAASAADAAVRDARSGGTVRSISDAHAVGDAQEVGSS